jgi:hypothetical protein
MSSPNVVELSQFRQRNAVALSVSSRICRHCGASLLEGEREEECSSAFNLEARASLRAAPRRLYVD